MVSRKVQCRTGSTVHVNGPPSAINALYVLEAYNVAKAQSVYILHPRAVGKSTQQSVAYTDQAQPRLRAPQRSCACSAAARRIQFRARCSSISSA